MKIIDRFIEAVRDERFVEAHEILEESWKELKKIDKTEANLQKGLINGATAIALYLKGKTEPSKRVWETFEKYRDLLELNFQDSDKYRVAQKVLDEKHEKYNKLK